MESIFLLSKFAYQDTMQLSAKILYIVLGHSFSHMDLPPANNIDILPNTSNLGTAECFFSSISNDSNILANN